MIHLENQITDLIESARVRYSALKPSQWAEKHRVMPSENPWPGPFSFNRTPYCREILDCFAEDHPARVIVVKKGAQVGMSAGVIENAIGWIISENPGNILYLTGHQDLTEESINKRIDKMIDSCGLRPLIKPSVLRKKNQRTGDTSKGKEFPHGSLIGGSASNHKLLRQISAKFGFGDDVDAAKNKSRGAGSTTSLIKQRFAAFHDSMKLCFASSPELLDLSIIESEFLLGDQRNYNIPCPVCHNYITIEWEKSIDDKEKAGIYWKLDDRNELVPGSVGYICQECSGFFTEKTKADFLLAGNWKPTAQPSEVGYYSYYLPSLLAPPGMYNWEYYVRWFLRANPIGQPQIESEHQSFVNLGLGQPFKPVGDAPKANDLLIKNTREYEIGIIPEKLSIRDGNGKIVLITLASDLNGKLEDARLDYEIVAHSETGATYSIDHASIGTFVFREYEKKYIADRKKYTYELNRENSVWKDFLKVISTPIQTDTGRRMKIFITGIDTGYCEEQAFSFIDKFAAQYNIVGLKGDKENKYTAYGVSVPNFKLGRSKKNLYLLEVNQLKNQLNNLFKLNWDENHDESQPEGFPNFPMAVREKYSQKTFFSHYEAEHRIVKQDAGQAVAMRWEKKNATVQNHYWDVRVYNLALKDIFLHLLFQGSNIKNPNWNDYVSQVLSINKK